MASYARKAERGSGQAFSGSLPVGFDSRFSVEGFPVAATANAR
jgi:hypothetical protein